LIFGRDNHLIVAWLKPRSKVAATKTIPLKRIYEPYNSPPKLLRMIGMLIRLATAKYA